MNQKGEDDVLQWEAIDRFRFFLLFFGSPVGGGGDDEEEDIITPGTTKGKGLEDIFVLSNFQIPYLVIAGNANIGGRLSRLWMSYHTRGVVLL